jgi:hypothetical protein
MNYTQNIVSGYNVSLINNKMSYYLTVPFIEIYFCHVKCSSSLSCEMILKSPTILLQEGKWHTQSVFTFT